MARPVKFYDKAYEWLEEHEQEMEIVRQALIDGENSGTAGKLDMGEIIREARQEVDLEV